MIHIPDPSAKFDVIAKMAVVSRNDERPEGRRLIIKFEKPKDWSNSAPAIAFSAELLMYIRQRGRASIVYFQDRMWKVKIIKKFRTPWHEPKALKIDIVTIEIKEDHMERLREVISAQMHKWGMISND